MNLSIHIRPQTIFLFKISGAIASSEVKQKLQEFVLTKKQREAAASNMTNSPPQFRHW